MRRFRLAFAAVAFGCALVFFEMSGAAAQIAIPIASPSDEHVPPTKDEMASIGCLLFGAGAAAATGAAGLVVIAATGGGAATYANIALPVLGTAFAAGCGVGILAWPGASWLMTHFPHLVGPAPEPTVAQ